MLFLCKKGSDLVRIGTTPTHTFTLPDDIASSVSKVRVIYTQGDRKVLRKDVTQLTGNSAVVNLTQEDTLKFHHRKPVKIQLRVLNNDGKALTSDVIERKPYECLESEVFA